MTTEDQEKFKKVMYELEDMQEELNFLHGKSYGIKSTQVGVLILYLIQKGIIK